MNFKDITGQKFGRLTVISYFPGTVENPGKWLCRCICGNTKKVDGNHLRRGNCKSCGCLAREETSKRSKKSGTYLRMVYYRYKANAKLRNIDFLISIQEMETIIKAIIP